MKKFFKYHLAIWHHEFGNAEPDWLLSEYNEEGDVLRLIEHFRDGRLELKIASPEVASVVSLDFFPEQIEANSNEFSFFFVTREQFEHYSRLSEIIVDD